MHRLLFLAFLVLPAHAETPDPARAAGLVIESANAFRREHRLPALEPNAKLSRAAREFAEYMSSIDRLDHEADGTQPADRAKRQGYAYCMVAENIGYQFRSDGFRSVQQLVAGFMKGWEDSPGHRRNLLDREPVETGVGVARSAKSGRYYAVQLFGRPASMSVKFTVSNELARDVEYRVGAERYALPSMTVRSHELCGPDTVTLQGDTVAPKAGDRWAVVEESRRLRLKKR